MCTGLLYEIVEAPSARNGDFAGGSWRLAMDLGGRGARNRTGSRKSVGYESHFDELREKIDSGYVDGNDEGKPYRSVGE